MFGIDWSLLALFVPTFFFISITPGMCMTLALTLGMAIGVRRTLWMMLGEVCGSALVALAAVLGIAALMMRYPLAFQLFKFMGGTYLVWLGISLWRGRGRLVLIEGRDGDQSQPLSRRALALQGFVTAVANPKAWAFYVTLLPPFLTNRAPLGPQLAVLLGIIMLLEFLCLLIYAGGGRTLSKLLQRSENVRLMNRIAGSLLLGVGVLLVLG